MPRWRPGAAGYGEMSPEQVNSRNGYRLREQYPERAGSVTRAAPSCPSVAATGCAACGPAGRAAA
jgi:hypothetical protein